MEFKFLKPGKLTDKNLELSLIKMIPADDSKGYVPSYNFELINTDTREKMGDINLRVGYNENIKYGGNMGYGVDEKFRGQHYASRAIKLLLPFAKQHGLKEITITCDPENTASRKTCELAGGKFEEIVDIPENNDQYKRGDRQNCIYKFVL